MVIMPEEHTDPPADGPIVVRDGDGAEHELTVVACAGMVCIQDQERREPAYVMPAAAALQLGLQLIRACLTIRRSRLRRPARRGLVH